MPSLRTEFRKFQPINSSYKLSIVVDLLKRRGTVINDDVDNLVCEVISDNMTLSQWHEIKEGLKIEIANSNLKKVKRHSSKKSKSKAGRHGIGLSDGDPIKKIQSLNRQLSNVSTNKGLLDEKYEYGLSD